MSTLSEIMNSKMRVLITFDDGSEVFLPNLFFYDYFKNFVRKKNKRLINVVIKQFIKNLTIDKKNKIHFLNFQKLEQQVYNHIQATNMIALKTATLHERGVTFDTGNKPKDRIDNHIKEYEAYKKTSRYINIHDILESSISRFSYLSFLDFKNLSPLEKEDQRIIRKYLIKNEGFYLDLFSNHISSNWLNSSKHKEVIIQFLFENILKVIPNSFRSNFFNDKNFLYLMNEYLCLKVHTKNYPIIDWETQQRWLKDTSQDMVYIKSERKKFFKEQKKYFEVYLNNQFFSILKLYSEILSKKSFTDESIAFLETAIVKFLRHSFESEKLEKNSQFFFGKKSSLAFLNNIGKAASTEGLLFFSSHIPDSLFVKELYKNLNQREQIQIEDKTLLINKVNPELNKLILLENWKELIIFVGKNYSNSSEFKKFFFKTIHEVIGEKVLCDNFIFDSDFELQIKKDYLYIAKKYFLKKQFKEFSSRIYSKVNFVKNYNTTSILFNYLHSDALLETITNLEKKSLYELKEKTTFFQDLIQLENSNILTKILGKLQLTDFTIFDKEKIILNSKNFQRAFMFNLKKSENLNRNPILFENNYFFNFLLTNEGMKWLKGKNGQAWLEGNSSKNWRNSKKGKFVSDILLRKKSLIINSQESFDLYLSVLNSDTQEKIDKNYLINHNPETFEYLLSIEPELLVSINLDFFNWHSNLNKIILENSELFFQNHNENISVVATKSLMVTGEIHKLKNAAAFIDLHFVNFYKFNQNWFVSDDFTAAYKKFNSKKLYQQVFDYNISQLTTTSKETLEMLASVDDELFFEMVKSTNTTPLWLISEKYFIEILALYSQDSIEYFDILGQRYFHKSSSGILLNKQWFYEFVTNFSKKFTNNSNKHRESPHILYCQSGDCISPKTGKAKEGYKNFYDTLVAISHYFSYLRVINRPYQCPYTDLWHTTSQWN